MTTLDRIGQEYVNLTLIKHQHHDKWDVYWMADTAFWKREDLYVDRYYREYPYKPLKNQPFMSLEAILSSSEILLAELEKMMDSLSGNDLIRGKYLDEHIRALIIKTRLLMGEKMPYDVFIKEMFSLTAPKFNEEELSYACEKMEKLLPGEGTLAEKIAAFKENILIPKDKFPEVMDYSAEFFHKMAVEHMGVKDCCMPRMRYRSYDKSIDFITILFGYDYDEITLEQNFNKELPYYLDNIREVAGHELEPGHFTFMNLRTKGAIDTGYPELGLNLHCPSSAFIEAGARISVELSLDTDEKARAFDEKLFEIAGIDKKYIDYLPEFREFVRISNYAKIEAEKNFWNGVWTDEECREFAAKYALNYNEMLRFRKDPGHYTSHHYSTDMLRNYYNSRWDNTEDKWNAYKLLCEHPFCMKEIEDGSFDPYKFEI